jgi:diketogulonate reductase-like aldo/keto reductase
MAYSPLSNRRNNILNNPAFIQIANKHNYNPAQLALAWTIRRPGIIAIPASLNTAHIESNLQSQYIKLTTDVLADIDKEFPL